jgi:mannose-6-phosphate isomerase-like protein (cupin superfamily)
VIVTRESLRPILFDGLRIFDYTATGDVSSSLAVIEVPSNARHATAFSKRSDKYYLVTKGEVRFVLEGKEVRLGPGDFCYVRCGQRFSYSNDLSEAAMLVLVHTPRFNLENEVFAEEGGGI